MRKLTNQSPPNFEQAIHTNSGRVLNESWTLQTQPPDPRVPQVPKPKQITGEKTLLYKNVQMGDFNFSQAVPGLRLASLFRETP